LTSVAVRYATLAYGASEDLYRQTTMLMVSLLAHAPERRELVVLTDHPDRFDWLRTAVRIEAIEPSRLTSWIGPSPFSMRQKLEAAAALTRADAPLVFLDADVVAVASLREMTDELRAGARFMHKREFQLGSSTRKGNLRLWRDLERQQFGGFGFRPTDAMWNSGVLGLPSGDEGRIREALSLYDAMAAAGIRHFATEQLVVAAVLERAGHLREARQWFTHYWGNKESFSREIERRLGSIHERKLTPQAAAQEFLADPIRLPAEVRLGRVAKIRKWWGRN
jgi:hypothetical protein